ncbi:MAG: nucleotidyltransferase family protein [Gammaproteobacteria bacterium]|nr:nucleotidyltransferase family protein [Gammaproteobacteria bacterium]
MKAMILAAGRGERMRPLTDNIPKPMLELGGKTLIEYHLDSLKEAGVSEFVINLAYLGEKIVEKLGDGSDYGVSIEYSREGEALETGGGIFKALPLLGEEPFILVNGDVWTDFPFATFTNRKIEEAHLVMVSNPEHHPRGDFFFENDRVYAEGQPRLTYSGIGIYHPQLFKNCSPGRFPLAPLLRAAMARNAVSGEHYAGIWSDIGTPERLYALDELLCAHK